MECAGKPRRGLVRAGLANAAWEAASERERTRQWTRDGKLRQPVFLGLRDDKPATEVRREAA
jgi:bifunctional non-homologous end joining protein LigD